MRRHDTRRTITAMEGSAMGNATIDPRRAHTDDIQTLEQLNRGYVQDAGASDVRWFDANLAPEFANGNSDGSFSDRAAFLAFIGKPSALANLRAEDVRIQVVGDIGIIHARTAYTKPDGQPGAGRYTDIWWQ